MRLPRRYAPRNDIQRSRRHFTLYFIIYFLFFLYPFLTPPYPQKKGNDAKKKSCHDIYRAAL